MSCKCKCNLNQKWNSDKCWCECKYLKIHRVCKKDYIWNPVRCTCKSGKYLAIIIDDSAVTCDGNRERTKTVLTKTVLTKSTLTNFYILLAFLLIIITFLIDVCIYCYLIKYKSKQKHLLLLSQMTN